MGYLAPEYATTAILNDKSDIYAFGVVVFQLLTGKSDITHLNRHQMETSRFKDMIDLNLEGNFSESEAEKLGKIAMQCTYEFPHQRPSMEFVVQELCEK